MAIKRLDVKREIKKVIGMEAEALRRVMAAVDGSFVKAVEWLYRCKGKVILTGVGKSGLIAQKIAATLSSTGTPAAYLPSSEAMHGSLGFVQKQDLVLAIAKSGESDELSDLLPRLKAIGAKLIAVTANPKSTLARHAGLVLYTPVFEEACPLNLAPTCSTTVALAVGDALAVALMKIKGFQTVNFAKNHPGGRLGRRLNLTVADIMRSGTGNPVVPVSATISQMLVEITKKQTGAVSVIDRKGRFVGLVTDFDIRRMLEKGVDVRKLGIRRIMNPDPITIRPEESAAKAVAIMDDRKTPFNVLPVVDRKRRSVGMIQVHDLRARGL